MMVYETHEQFCNAHTPTTGGWFNMPDTRWLREFFEVRFSNTYDRHCRIGKITLKPKE